MLHVWRRVAIGLDKIWKEIMKFTPPSTDSEGIGRAFKGWVGTCCEREWSANRHIHNERTVDPKILAEWENESIPSIEEMLLKEEEALAPPSPVQHINAIRRQILDDEIHRIPEAMRDALLETEGEKDVANPSARGKQGESAAIAEKYGVTPGAVRTARLRLVQRVRDRFSKEICL